MNWHHREWVMNRCMHIALIDTWSCSWFVSQPLSRRQWMQSFESLDKQFCSTLTSYHDHALMYTMCTPCTILPMFCCSDTHLSEKRATQQDCTKSETATLLQAAAYWSLVPLRSKLSTPQQLLQDKHKSWRHACLSMVQQLLNYSKGSEPQQLVLCCLYITSCRKCNFGIDSPAL